jgi:hypothetical protein
MRRIALMIAIVVLSVPALAAQAIAAPVPGTSCDVFPSTNIWNTRVDSLPVDPRSDTWLTSADAGSTNLHPDFGPPSYGLPFTTVSRTHRDVRVDFHYGTESDRGRTRSTRTRPSRAARTVTR